MKYRLIIPFDQAPFDDGVNDLVLQGQPTGEAKIKVSAAWLGRSRSEVLDERQLTNYFERFKHDTNADSRFYVERIIESTDG